MNRTELKRTILYFISRTTKENTLTAKKIAEKLTVDERTVRDAIKDLREDGYPIISHPGFKGYYLGNTEDIKIVACQYRTRAYTMLATAKMLETKDPKEWKLF